MWKRFPCQACSENKFVSRTISDSLAHLIAVHRNDPHLVLNCEVATCNRSFRNVYSYKSHLSRDHKDIDLKRPVILEPENNVANDGNNDHEFIVDCEQEQEDHIQAAVDQDPHECQVNHDQSERTNALFLLRTKEVNLLTQKTLDDIVQGTTELVRDTVRTLRSDVFKCLENAGILAVNVPGIVDVFSEESFAANPFAKVLTKNKQRTYYQDNFNLIEPRRVTLGHSARQQRRAGITHREVIRSDEMMYVPLLESLQLLLNKESILAMVLNSHKRNDDLIEDFCDGQLYNQHQLFSNDQTALQLMLYYGEVEVSNPLGTKTGKHKLGVFYFTLSNIHPKFRAQLDAIQLLAIVTTPNLKKYGIDSILEPFMEDLEKLEQDDGHLFQINGREMLLRGTITYVSGDNLGSQLVGGFKEGPGANLKCRHCMGSANDVKTKFTEGEFVLRTPQGYEYQCQQIHQDPELSKMYGIIRRSILCESRYYHPVNGLPGDAMHDLLEGVLQYQCKELLKHIIDDVKLITLEFFNQRIKKFDYGYYNDKNKPSPITQATLSNDTNSIKQKAAQTWCFAKFLPLILGNIVPEDDERWQHFTLLLHIVDIVFSPVTSVDTIGVLEGYIEEYLWQFCVLYPRCSVIPKMHYMVHYPAHMYKFGPMVRTWCMRYEAKHHYFKRLASFMGNFTNVPYSLAERHQARQCYQMIDNYFLEKPTMLDKKLLFD